MGCGSPSVGPKPAPLMTLAQIIGGANNRMMAKTTPKLRYTASSPGFSLLAICATTQGTKPSERMDQRHHRPVQTGPDQALVVRTLALASLPRRPWKARPARERLTRIEPRRQVDEEVANCYLDNSMTKHGVATQLTGRQQRLEMGRTLKGAGRIRPLSCRALLRRQALTALIALTGIALTGISLILGRPSVLGKRGTLISSTPLSYAAVISVSLIPLGTVMWRSKRP